MRRASRRRWSLPSERSGLPLERVGLEACSLTAWLHDELRAAGLPAVCIETRQANAAMKTMPNKTDRNDARALAQIMRTGWFRQVHVKSRQCRLWRSLLVARRTVLNEMRAIENVVRAVLREAGLKLGIARPRGLRRARARARRAMPGVMAIVEPLLAILATMLDQLARLTKQVLDIVREEAVCRRLMSVPGVGPITALAFRATIDRPDRFRRSRDVGAHLGLTPARYQSGETDIQGRISRCGDELARTALYEAAHTLLVRSRKWSALRAWGMKVAKPRGMARARVAVARKLAVILHRMWSDGTEFRFGKEPAQARARERLNDRRPRHSELAREGGPDRSRGDDGRGDLVESPEPEGHARKVVGQIETPRPPDPIMRRPRADREEKRVTHGSEIPDRKEEQLDLNAPIREDFSESLERLLIWSRRSINEIYNLIDCSAK